MLAKAARRAVWQARDPLSDDLAVVQKVSEQPTVLFNASGLVAKPLLSGDLVRQEMVQLPSKCALHGLRCRRHGLVRK